MVITVEDYKQIRQLYLSGTSQRAIAKQLNISRNTVAKYCAGSFVPWERKTPQRESTVVTAEVVHFIKACLDVDAHEPNKKQHHTAKRIYDRLVTERGFTGGESTIRAKVKELRGSQVKAFIPLVFSPGEAMQVDWGVAQVYLSGKRTTVYVFCARLCFSCAPFVIAFLRQNKESFSEAVVRTFIFFDGASEKIIFDNDRVAVKEGFGMHAKMQTGYTALSAHYGFDALFCNPAAGHEKGLVEGLVGWARRNILVPVPRVESIDELNQSLEQRCLAYRNHQVRGKKSSVGDMYTEEKEFLRPLPRYELETARCSNVRVSAYATVRFDTNDYSVPTTYCSRTVSVKGYAQTVKVYYQGNLIASHHRCFEKYQSIYTLEHYLPLLESRSRAVFNAKPVRDILPKEFLSWLKESTASHKELMDLLYRCVDQGWKHVWHNTNMKKTASLPADNITVDTVNLGKYDELLTLYRSGVCQ